MKKLIGFIILLSLTSCSTVTNSRRVEQVDPGFVLLDAILYRPIGLVATVVGTGMFIGISPLTAFASIPEPHNAFAKTADILIFSPVAYTFIRPVGDRNFPYQIPYKPGRVATQNKVEPSRIKVMPGKQVIAPPAPAAAQPPQRYRSAGDGL
ncbi:MAG: hypothetical protein PHG00_01250 [Methylococcales bacterium]|nr:hypothetical protein [Methylococcales bacterium]